VIDLTHAEAAIICPVTTTRSGVDWTGFQEDQTPIEPLDARTFAIRLRLLSERAGSLAILRKAFTEQQSRGEQLSRDPEPASRPSR
jgi:hypothetical protein